MRLLIEDVTLTREPEMVANVRLKGGVFFAFAIPQSHCWGGVNEIVPRLERYLTAMRAARARLGGAFSNRQG